LISSEVGNWVLLLQPLASVAVALAGLVVAIVAAVVGYRNAFGWAPILFVKTQAVIPRKNPQGLGVSIAFEVWNRRKYPVVIRSMDVHWQWLHLEEVLEDDTDQKEKAWRITNANKAIVRQKDFVVPPGNHQSFSAFVRLSPKVEYSRLDPLEGQVRVLVFDPRKRKHKIIAALPMNAEREARLP
jgi:hypothetical protein